MPQVSDVDMAINIYEENLRDDLVWNLISQCLESVPKLKSNLLRVIYLQNNKISVLPDDFFPSLPRLMWLDLRDNCLIEIPKSIQDHQSLTHLLLQNNKLTSLPNELGTVANLKVLQLQGNPLIYPTTELIKMGVSKVLSFLREKYLNNLFAQSQLDASESGSTSAYNEDNILDEDGKSYNSVLDEAKLKKNKTLSIQLSEKDVDDSEEEQRYGKMKGKCPKLANSRKKAIPSHYQSSKYLKPLYADRASVLNDKIKQNYLRELKEKKYKELINSREKILQDRKNIEHLKNWRKNYKNIQITNKNGVYKIEAKSYPFDTNPEYMTLLSREDIEKDLPDKYKKKLVRHSKTVPRKNCNDINLAMKIKQLFENLEAIDLNKQNMTPRTEQKVFLNEIQKITEIKEKLTELSAKNLKSVVTE